MNKKFLAILVLLSVIPGCWGPRYSCNRPCGEPATTCVEATDCYQAPAQSTTCYEEYPEASDTTCYEADGYESDNVEYCYEAEDYPEGSGVQYSQESMSYPEEAQDQEFEEFDYDEFDQ